MRGWWSLPQAAPILLRHLLAYAELAEEDLQRFSRRASARLIALVVALLGAMFLLFMVCVAIIAATWDTPHRMVAIFWLLGFFAVLTLAALVAALSGARDQPSMFANVKREWSQDRMILDRLLAGREERAPGAPPASPDAAERPGPP
jgi:uncharacterized membrane protein YqjE